MQVESTKYVAIHILKPYIQITMLKNTHTTHTHIYQFALVWSTPNLNRPIRIPTLGDKKLSDVHPNLLQTANSVAFHLDDDSEEVTDDGDNDIYDGDDDKSGD